MAKDRMDPAGRGKPARPVTPAPQGSSRRAFFILIAVVAIAGVTGLSYLSSRPKAADVRWDSTLPKMQAQGHVMGSDSARLEVIEFGDFECPACGSFANIAEPDVRTKLVNTGTIRFRFIDYPLPMHKNTWHASRAAWCAGDQGKFWEMHDAIFRYQDMWNGEATDKPDKVLSEIAQKAGMKMDEFSSCLSARKYQAQIQANFQEAVTRKVPSTPTFVFGSVMVARPGITYDVFKSYVDSLLGAAAPAKPAPAKAATKKK